jgi:hypothetical protein
METNKDYPCMCENMRWFNENYHVFIRRENRWMLNFMKLDLFNKSYFRENFGISIQYCMFCGKKLLD